MEVYKIGRKYLPQLDVNSAIYEYNILKIVLNGLDIPNSIAIIGGKLDTCEPELQNILDKYAFKVFIATDTISITTCKDVINKCNLLLHQCPHNNIEGIVIPQQYSFVPELFFNLHHVDEQDNLLFYAGAYRDIKDTINDYITNNNSKILMKDEHVDNRISYLEYLDELSRHKYGLVVLRKENHIRGWITSRFVEYIACNVFPIVHAEYDEDDHFGSIKCKNGKDASTLINWFNKHEVARCKIIQNYKLRFAKDKYKILTIIKEAYYE